MVSSAYMPWASRSECVYSDRRRVPRQTRPPQDPLASGLPEPARLKALEQLACLLWEIATRPTISKTFILLI